MANITIGGSGGGMFKDAIPSALQFSTWDAYKWFQQGGQGLNVNHQNFYYNPVHYHHVQDVENKKFFALPQGKNNNANYKLADQKPLGCYKYDHQTDQSEFIEFDRDDVYEMRNKITQNSYENLLYDETTDRLFFLNFTTKELWEIDQSTGQFTQKTTCTLGGSICSAVCSGGKIFVIDTSKNFVKYDIAGNSWSFLSAMSGYSQSMSQNYCRLLTDGTWVVFVPYQQMTSTSYPLMKYNISAGTWSAATTSNAPNQSTYYISEIFNGYVYVQYLNTSNNYNQIWKYSLSGNSWTQNAINLRSKGMTNGGAWSMFAANGKLYWYGSKQYYDPNTSRPMARSAIWEMDTAQNFTETTKHVPVEFGNWCFERTNGYENDMMQVQKSCGRYQFYNSFHANSRGYRYFPYIDPIGKTIEWIKAPMEANKEKDWQGWAAVVKNGKLYMMDAKTCDLFVCTIGTWNWTKLDNLFVRLGNKTPYSFHGNAWMYGSSPNNGNGATPWQAIGGLFTVKEDTEDIFLVCPRYSSDQYCYVYKFDISANQWSLLNANAEMPSAYWGQSSHSTYQVYKNHLVVSNQNSSWLLFLSHCYTSGNSHKYVQRYYAFNPLDGTFEHITGHDSSSWYGSYGFTLDGKPLWHTSSSYSKMYYNDMETMAYDITNKLLEQVLENQDQYLYMQKRDNHHFVFNIDSANFEKGFAIRAESNDTNGGIYQEWGFEKQIDAIKGGYLLGWSRNSSLGNPQRYGRIMIDNDGVRSSIVNDALPDLVSDSALIFTTKAKKNFKLYLEQWCSSNGLVTFFAPTN